jgi:hypothetical protein
MWSRITLAAMLVLATTPALADEVVFLNGDRLTGKIISAAGGKLILKTDAAGEITIDMAKVKTFSTDAPIGVKVGEQKQVISKVTPGNDGQVQAQIAPGTTPQPLAIKDITALNPEPPTWHGSLALTGLFTSGNSETTQIGFSAAAAKRWETERLTFLAGYTFGREKDPDTDEKRTTTDYGFASPSSITSSRKNSTAMPSPRSSTTRWPTSRSASRPAWARGISGSRGRPSTSRRRWVSPTSTRSSSTRTARTSSAPASPTPSTGRPFRC